jgi:hypothetical protein
VTEAPDGTWNASWQDADAFSYVEVDRKTALAWATAQPTEKRLIMDHAIRDYVPFDETLP